MNRRTQYKIKSKIYKAICSLPFPKLKEKYYANYLKYKEAYKKSTYDFKLDTLMEEVENIKYLIATNTLFASNSNPYKSSVLLENLDPRHLNFPTNSYLKNTRNNPLNNIYIEAQLNLLNHVAGFDSSIDKKIYTDIVLDLANKATPENRLKIYDVAVELLFQYQRYTSQIGRIFNLAKEDFDAGFHTSKLLCAYICYLLCVNDETNAQKYLELYLKNYDKTELLKFLPVGDLAYRNGIKEPDFELVSKLFHKFKESSNNNSFENYIKGKRVAIVGNGPQELGSGNGKKIDEYDEVIRFNNFSDDEKYAADYGHKTTIWATNGCLMKKDIPEIKVNLTRLSPWSMPTGYKLRDYKYYLEDDTNLFVYVPEVIWNELNDKYGIECATCGLQMIYWVKKINPEFSAEDCYGFSFKQEDATQKDLVKHYDNNSYSSGHSLDKEKKAIFKILNEDN